MKSIAYDDPRPFRDQVREILRDRILSGTIPPGSRLIERELAEEMGVSRVPIREAIRMLQSEDLISVQAHRRVVVRRLDSREISDLFDVRESLDVLEARLAAVRATDSDIAELRHLLDEAWRAFRNDHKHAMDEANASFHSQIALTAGNRVLASILEPISARLHWLYAQNGEPERVLAEHEAILTAISEGSPETAAAVALDHVRAARRMVMQAWPSDESTDTGSLALTAVVAESIPD